MASRIRGNLATVIDYVRSSLWPLPAVSVLVAVVAAVILTTVDRTVEGLPDVCASLIFGGDAAAARSVLESVAGSVITVTALTFSLTVVTLQLASSQFSPRLLRMFTRDRVVQGTLSLFLGTFVFTLTVLRVVRSASASGPEFVPRFSVTATYLLTLATVLGLVLFLAHLAREIRVETMLRAVAGEATDNVDHVLAGSETTDDHVQIPSTAVPLLSSTSGFVGQVTTARLLEAAEDLDAVIVIDAGPGDSAIHGVPAGMAWTVRTQAGVSADARERLQHTFAAAVNVTYERTGVDDPSFGLRQLSDVAAKALSPGVNDPTTATHALSHSSALLCHLVRLPLGDELIRDDTNTIRVIVRRPTLSDLLHLALDQPRRYGIDEPQVVERLFCLLREVAWTAETSVHRDAVRAELRRLRAAVAGVRPEADQTARYDALAATVEAALDGRWPGVVPST
jgi:uncharacterized membrane protein